MKNLVRWDDRRRSLAPPPACGIIYRFNKPAHSTTDDDALAEIFLREQNIRRYGRSASSTNQRLARRWGHNIVLMMAYIKNDDSVRQVELKY